MKKLYTIITAIMLTLCLAGCTLPVDLIPDQPQIEQIQPDDPSADYAALYDDTLRRVRDVVIYGFETTQNADGCTGIQEITTSLEPDEALNSIGYSIQDLSGDGIPELIIASIEDNGDLIRYGSQLLSVYTLAGDVPVLTLEGWARNRYSLLENGDISYSGSGGAMYTCFGTYHLSRDGTSLECREFYFTGETYEDPGEVSLYYSTTDEWNTDTAEELHITSDEFFAIRDDMELNVQYIDLIPFSEFR